jgi:hypothetical protein
MERCPDCDGEGYFYFNAQGDKLTVSEWLATPAQNRDKIVCDRCEGMGEIEDDYEPDYDDYDN